MAWLPSAAVNYGPSTRRSRGASLLSPDRAVICAMRSSASLHV
ncbi:hypothetical protein HMPREF9206_1293 [Cutibacterium acnes J139]|nr:hypothetical protein HMPREF9206_1293 [Cutibacterium acnes J139]